MWYFLWWHCNESSQSRIKPHGIHLGMDPNRQSKCQDGKADSSISMLTYTFSLTSAHLSAQSDDKQPLTEQKTQLEEFWKLETLGIREPVQENNDDKQWTKLCKNLMKRSSLKTDGTNRYRTGLEKKRLHHYQTIMNWQWEGWDLKSIDCHEMTNISRNMIP